MNNDKKMSLAINVMAKNAARAKSSQQDIESLQAIAGNVNDKLSLVTNVLAKNAARVKTVQADVVRVDDKVNNIAKSLGDDIKKINHKLSLITNVLARNASRVKGLQATDNATQETKSTLTLTTALNIIALSLQRINGSLSKLAGVKMIQGNIGAPPAAPAGIAPSKDKEEPGLFDLFKSLFTNPAVVAALAGVVYTILPKEVQDEVKGLFTGFSDGLSEVMGENEESGLSGLNTAIKVAGGALAVVFGAKIIGGIASAITTTIKIIRLLGAGGKMLGKMGAAGAIVAAGGAAIGAAAMMGGDKKEEGASGGAGATPESAGGGEGSIPGAAPKEGAASAGKPSAAATSVASMPGGYLGKAAKYIASKEGLPKGGKAYWDPPGQQNLVSVGYGHQIKPEEYQQGFIQAGDEKVSITGNKGIDTTMTPQQAEKLLAMDLPRYEQAAAKPLGEAWNKLDDNQKAALISYAYNTGSTASLVKAGLKDAILSGDMDKAAKIIANGVSTAGGVHNEHLAARRRDEAALFASAKGESSGGGSSGSPVQVAAKPEPSTNMTGQEVAAKSLAVKEGREPKAETQVATANQNNTSEVGSKSTVHSPIPSPIANRGSLGSSVSHNTAYA